MAPYLAMSYLYKRSNRFWHQLIQCHLVHGAWKPLIELSRVRHLHYRRKLAICETAAVEQSNVVSAGV